MHFVPSVQNSRCAHYSRHHLLGNIHLQYNMSATSPPLTLWARPPFYGTLFFMGIAGLLTYIRWKYRWILSFSTLLSTVFVIINLLKPEIHDQSLMPALQSIWFIPHVTVYMFSYSVLGCAFIIALCGLVHHKEKGHGDSRQYHLGVTFVESECFWVFVAEEDVG